MAQIVDKTRKEQIKAYGQRSRRSSSVKAMTGIFWLRGNRLNVAIGRMHWWGPMKEMLDGLALLSGEEKERTVKIPGMLLWKGRRGLIRKKEVIWMRSADGVDANSGGGIARCDSDKLQEVVARLASDNLDADQLTNHP